MRTSTLLNAWNHDAGCRADVIVPFDRREPVRVHPMRGEISPAQLDELRRSGRYLVEQGPHAVSMKLDSGWTVARP